MIPASRHELIVPLRERACQRGGDLRPLSMMDKFADRHLYVINLPFPGYSTETIEVTKGWNAFRVATKTPWIASTTFEYDSEYIHIGEWTVEDGMFYITIEYILPEKYKIREHLKALPSADFVAQYGALLHD